MNANAVLVLCIVASAATGAGVSLAVQPARAADASPVIASLEQSLADLRERNKQLEQRLDALGRAPIAAPVPATAGERAAAPVISPEMVASAVDAYLARRGGPGAAAGPGADAPVAFDVAAKLAELSAQGYWENPELWKAAHAAGRMDEVVAALEARAKQRPNDVGEQMGLANAYLAYLQLDSSKWQYSMKADEVFDRVLTIDNNHWEARFTKAMSYTFWPDFLGKKKEAIQHFETLVTQQDALPVRDHHAQTYLFLGNLLEQRDPARAREVGQKGLQRHPGNTELQQRLAR
jgi:tetratricopeptide (TPR) repeat protein